MILTLMDIFTENVSDNWIWPQVPSFVYTPQSQVKKSIFKKPSAQL